MCFSMRIFLADMIRPMAVQRIVRRGPWIWSLTSISVIEAYLRKEEACARYTQVSITYPVISASVIIVVRSCLPLVHLLASLHAFPPLSLFQPLLSHHRNGKLGNVYSLQMHWGNGRITLSGLARLTGQIGIYWRWLNEPHMYNILFFTLIKNMQAGCSKESLRCLGYTTIDLAAFCRSRVCVDLSIFISEILCKSGESRGSDSKYDNPPYLDVMSMILYLDIAIDQY